jgi:hypothetical protein
MMSSRTALVPAVPVSPGLIAVLTQTYLEPVQGRSPSGDGSVNRS